jgi:hypothetical protein
MPSSSQLRNYELCFALLAQPNVGAGSLVGGPVGPFPPFFLNLAGLEKKNQVPKT